MSKLSDVSNRLIEVERELAEIADEKKSRTTFMPEGEFDHAKWLMAERVELYEQRDAMLGNEQIGEEA